MPKLSATYELEVEAVRANGWGVLVSAWFLDRGAEYSGTLKRRPIQFMVSEFEQPRVGQKLSLTIEST